MKNLSLFVTCILIAWSFTNTTVQSQDMQFGAKAGISLYNITTSVSGGGFDVSETSSSRVGFAVGGYAVIPFTDMFSFQPELMFVQKGGNEDDDFFGDTELILNYLDIPLLLRFDIPVDAGVSPYLTAGPVVGIFLSGTEKFDGESESIDEGINTLNFGISIGGGISINQFNIDFRYEFGLADIFDDEDDIDDFGDFFDVDFSVKTSGLMLTIGYSF